MTEDNRWKVLTSYFKENSLVSQQLDSFNHFIKFGLQHIVDLNNRIEIANQNFEKNRKIYFTFEKVWVAKPPFIKEVDGQTNSILPNGARLRDITYCSSIFVDIVKEEIINNKAEVEKNDKVYIGDIPIMVKSEYCALHDLSDNEIVALNECPYDMGGYFIVNGSEKVIVAQERMATNTVHFFKTKYYYAELRSQPAELRSPSALYIKYINNEFLITLPKIRSDIPFPIIYKAMGFTNEREIINTISKDDTIINKIILSLNNTVNIKTKEDALNYIGKRGAFIGAPYEKRISFAKYILEREFIPHIKNERAKMYFFGQMHKNLILTILQKRNLDDRDYYGKKRLDLSGPLLSSLFRQLFSRLKKELQKQAERSVELNRQFNVINSIKSSIITAGFKYALGTGNWGEQSKALSSKAGVSQVLNRFNYISTISHLRRVNTPLGREGKMADPRQLHNSHWGMVCPAETPEGQAVGLVKNLSLMTYISVKSEMKKIIKYLRDFELLDLIDVEDHIMYEEEEERGEEEKNKFTIYINGIPIGKCSNINNTVNHLRKLRKTDVLQKDVSIKATLNSIEIWCDAGRPLRPLFCIINGRLDLPYDDFGKLLENGYIEYLDTNESENALIATEPENIDIYTTHCEIHQSMILGVSASIIPFPDHNQSPRNTYQSAMGKQAIGVFGTNFNINMHTHNILQYTAKPLVNTRSANYLQHKYLPTGFNAIVAIMSYSGYNQEDSIIMNRSAVDRGLFRSFLYRTYTDKEKGLKEKEIFTNDFSDTLNLKNMNYGKLDEDGLIKVGSSVYGLDIIIGKKTPFYEDGQLLYKDGSTPLKKTERGRIDSIMVSQSDGYRLVKIRNISNRIPQMGDKFASRHGQKGTVGISIAEYDLPFTTEGIVPDLIINPHAFPSRMSIGHLIESLLGKVVSLSGEDGDGTPFTNMTVGGIADALESYGYSKYGTEKMHNPNTGEFLEGEIFIGPLYYQRLKHMVEDKIHFRSRGPVQILTRQPVEGRSRDGGLRFGEMERDCIISHGASYFLKERLFGVSDKYECSICDCGYIKVSCSICNKIRKVLLPYGFKLMVQEMMGMNIAIKIEVK